MATENEVKITRPIHAEAGVFALDVDASSGSVLLRGSTNNGEGRSPFKLDFSAEEFATLGALVARVRKAQGSGKPKAAPKKAGARRGRKPAADAAPAAAPEAPLANGAAPAAGVEEPVL